MKHDHTCSCACGCGHKHESEHGHEHACCGEEKRGRARAVLTYALGACVTVCGFLPFLPMEIRVACAVLVYLFFGFSVFLDMLRGFARREIFTEFTLMCAASLGAFAIGEYADAAAVMLLYRLGEEISGGVYTRSQHNLRELLRLAPEYANVWRDGEVMRVEPSEVAVGEQILVRAGERVPMDGMVCKGGGSADTASVTGESVPLSLYEGVACPSGSVLLEGSVTICVTHRYEDSVVAKLSEAVMAASSRKSRAEKRMARIAHVITPVAFVLAALLALFLSLWTKDIARGVRTGLTALVVSCPCSLVLSVPLAYFAGVGCAAKQGIVFRGGEVMDRMARLSAIAFDKTGTLSESSLSFDGVDVRDTMDKDDFLQLSYDVLLHSPHAAAVAFCQAFAGTCRANAGEVTLVSGRGLSCLVDGKRAVFGNALWLREHGMEVEDCPATAILGAYDGAWVGTLHFSAHLKSDARGAVEELRALSVSRIAVISGDGEQSVATACRHAQIDEWSSSQSPSDKLDRLEEIMASNQGGYVGFCGDGMNDSAVIARADVGIAMGACGSALTVQSADVVIMDDDLTKIARAVQIARRTSRVASVCVALSFGIKIAVVLIGVLLSLGGYGFPLGLAIVADVGAAVAAVLQSMRASKI